MRALDYERSAPRPGTRELAAAKLGRSRLFLEGEPAFGTAQHVALITSGLVKVTLPSTEPDKVPGTLLWIRGPGDLVGEEAAILGEIPGAGNGHRAGRLRATAITSGYARVFPAEQLRRFLVEHPAVLWAVAEGLCERLKDAEARIASTAHDNADRRLAGLLCELERHGGPDEGIANGTGRAGTRIPLQLSQAEFASWIGSSRKTVDRTFARWRSRGIISTDYRTVIVHDLETLARIAGIQISRRAWNWPNMASPNGGVPRRALTDGCAVVLWPGHWRAPFAPPSKVGLSEIMSGSRVRPQARFVTYGKGHTLFAWTGHPVYQR